MGDAAKKLTLADFNDLDEYVAYKANELADQVAKVAKKNGCTMQEALDAMFRASVRHARRLRRNRLAQSN